MDMPFALNHDVPIRIISASLFVKQETITVGNRASIIPKITQRTPRFTVENINGTVYSAAVVERNLLSRSITLNTTNPT